jgi:hypothetical protein
MTEEVQITKSEAMQRIDVAIAKIDLATSKITAANDSIATAKSVAAPDTPPPMQA